MFNFLSDVKWDLSRLNANYLKKAPVAQMNDLIGRIRCDLLEMNKNLNKGSIEGAIGRMEEVLIYSADLYSDKLFEDKLIEDKEMNEAFVKVMVQNFMWRDLQILVTSNKLYDEQIFVYLLAYANVLVKYYENIWSVCLADDSKLEWYDQYHHQLYILVNAYMMFREKSLSKRVASEKAKKNAERRHAKSNTVKEEYLKLSVLQQKKKNYKSTHQLNIELQPSLVEIADRVGWTYTDKFQLEKTSYAWLLANKHNKN
jgi:hypothetical protein